MFLRIVRAAGGQGVKREYVHEFVPLLRDLAVVANRILKPDDVLAVLIGQTYLFEAVRISLTSVPTAGQLAASPKVSPSTGRYAPS